MQRGKSVKVKEVIESLCKLLSALGVQSVPDTDTFRRAKFNKGDAVENLWRLLYSLVLKAVDWECSCQDTKQHDLGAQARLVGDVLWQCGYGAPWLMGGEAGSRDLLLALGWVISSGSLLETLLADQAVGLETLSTLPGVPGRVSEDELSARLVQGQGAAGGGKGAAVPGMEEWERKLRRLQWEQGKLRLRWKSLHAAQAERSKLLHQVLSVTASPSDTHAATGCTGNSKELERLRMEVQLLETYLHWKQMEPLFWSWMDSVIDAELAEPSPPSHRGAVATAPKRAVVKGPRCQGDRRIRGTNELRETLLKLQVQLQAGQVEQRGHALLWEKNWEDGSVSRSEKVKIGERVELRLRRLAEGHAPQATSRKYRLCLLEAPPLRPSGRPKQSPSQPGLPISCQASHLIKKLREEEAELLQEVERLRRAQREELQAVAERLEGVVLIPPLKR
ncbi:hypothetical protein JZ751_002420 [Albula glossodonta]|uniref:Tubulin epsilon and delta complex protein 1 domain-containing protein n=1 Tax=Albula glossodonta TaxID=121402 RepID=A0A8T2N6Z3_9TELE|nr:hypothetical protein JZ751_002420 [Albula glossodonta]